MSEDGACLEGVRRDKRKGGAQISEKKGLGDGRQRREVIRTMGDKEEK
jgi:hypothetical protein